MWKSPLKVNASYALQDALRCNPNNWIAKGNEEIQISFKNGKS
jgi:hypothetical protein